MTGPNMPQRFPCWCRATYSWGGENKKDLGFIEGDLIEALNAGDGQWWTGRLRRDPRALGSFPSNFVQVLDESFHPAPNSRNASPRNTPPRQISPVKQKSVFRKPFQSYETIGPQGHPEGDRENTPEAEKEKLKREKSKFRPYSSMKTAQTPNGSVKQMKSNVNEQDNGFRMPLPPPRGGHRNRMSRAASPLPSDARSPAACAYEENSYQYHGRAPSPQPMYHHSRPVSPQPQYRGPSPAPNQPYSPSPSTLHRAPSPALSRPHSPLPSTFHDGSAYPQMLPPPSRTPSPNPMQQSYHGRAPSPGPMHQNYHTRVPSPNPTQQGYHSRAPSPAPARQEYRSTSPAPFSYDIGSSPPPPPPPAHRVAYLPSRAPSPLPVPHDQNTPAPRSPAGSHMTPSPLRDAMNDVMSSLHDMTAVAAMPQDRVHGEIWSPDEFELVRTQSQQHQRTLPAMSVDRHEPQVQAGEADPELDDFVQRMDIQLRQHQYREEYAPAPPLKGSQHGSSGPSSRPQTSSSTSSISVTQPYSHSQAILKHRQSAIEMRPREKLGRSYTTKTNATNSTEASSATQSSNSTQMTSRSIMSGYSAGGFSATSAGSLVRHKFGLGSQKRRPFSTIDTKSMGDLTGSAKSAFASDSSGSGPSYHSSHASMNQQDQILTNGWHDEPTEASASVFGGFKTPKKKRSGFFRKMIDSAKTTAKTGAATARATVSSASRPGSRSGASSPSKSMFGNMQGFGSGLESRPASSAGSAVRVNGGSSNEWMQVRRDVNRSNTLSRKERDERTERCEMLDLPAWRPIDVLQEQTEGDESLDGIAVVSPTDFNTANLALVDKSTRFISSVPPMINAAALAQSYVCRPHRTDVQRLRSIFTWVAERIKWEEDFEGQSDSRRVIQAKRGSSQEIAVLVRDMCAAIGLHAEVVRGYLKAPGETPDPDAIARGNHCWNATIIDGEWRIMDAALASPSHPRRGDYSGASNQVAEAWYFLARPMEICYTHIPLLPEQQHLVPAVQHEILTDLPCACPAYFRHSLDISGFDTSMLHLEGLEMGHFHVFVPEDVECVAETEARSFARDADGDLFESDDFVSKRALTQPEWIGGRKRFTIKALLPEDTSNGTLKVYAGKRGLMHSVKDNPHSLAFALPLTHAGQNPPYEFVLRHPTPHAQRHDLYIAQPQCARLVMNNTFVFSIRQHPSSLSRFTPDTWGAASTVNTGRPTSPMPFARPSSAMSMISTSASISQSGSQTSDSTSGSNSGMTASQLKPAKLAIQSPSQKIIRLTKKMDTRGELLGVQDGQGFGSVWETVIKVGERGTWRGLVLADRSARWCVFAEWDCV